jgi:hypothetical protein
MTSAPTVPGHGDGQPAALLITGMSGTGKSTVLAELARRGRRVIDTDHGGYAIETAEGQMWDEARITQLLDSPGEKILAGCVPNQGAFYSRFAAVVLLSAPDRAHHQPVRPDTGAAGPDHRRPRRRRAVAAGGRHRRAGRPPPRQ